MTQESCLLEELTLEADSLPPGGEGDRRKVEKDPPGGEWYFFFLCENQPVF